MTSPKTLLRFLPALLLTTLLPRPAHAVPSPFVTTLIAAKGDIGGKHDNSILSVADSAAIDSFGDVALKVTVTGSNKNSTNNQGILLYTGSTPTIVASIGPTENFPGYEFTKISDPVLSSSGALAFIGTMKVGTVSTSGTIKASNDSGVFLYESGSGAIVAQTGETVPIGPDNFPVPVTYTSFNQIAVENSGGVAFLAGVKGDHINTTGLFAPDLSGSTNVIAAKGTNNHSNAQSLYPSVTAFQTLPTVDGQSRTVDTVNGNGAILGELDPPSKAPTIGLAFLNSGGFSYSLVASVGQSSPVGGTFSALDEPAVNANGTVAFLSTIKGSGITSADNSLITVVTSGSNDTVVARTGQPAPDIIGNPTAAVFASFDNPVLNDNDYVAFVATLKLSGTLVTHSNNTGIYTDAYLGFQELARTGDPAPGGGKFSSFVQVVLPSASARGPIFLANLSGVPSSQNQALYAETADGSISRVIGKGDSLPFRGNTMETVTSINVFQTPANVVGQSRSFDSASANLVYQANFAHGLWGVYSVVYP